MKGIIYEKSNWDNVIKSLHNDLVILGVLYFNKYFCKSYVIRNLRKITNVTKIRIPITEL